VSSMVNLNSNTSAGQWFSLNSGSDLVTVCPTDVGYAVGTFEAQVYGYLEALSSAKVVTASKQKRFVCSFHLEWSVR
jgi:hypothetical protein